MAEELHNGEVEETKEESASETTASSNEVSDVQNHQVGDNVEGTVSKVEEKNALLDIGDKMDAILPIREVSHVNIERLEDHVSVGDSMQVQIIKKTDDEIVVSKRKALEEQAWQQLEGKLESGEVFEVEVAEVVKGGLVVDVGVRGFVPASLVERHFVEDFEDYKGNTLRVRVIELDREQNKVILSQKAVLDEEYEKQQHERIQTLEEGQVLDGTVERLTSFGAFVNIGGGVDGLVHVSEIAWTRVESPADVLQEGQTVQVKVLKVVPESGKVSLSIKQTEPSPWQKAAESINIGDVVEGNVQRLVSFGAFVEVLPGVEGLVHISQIARRRIGAPSEVLEVGQEVKAKVLDVNVEDERISLSIREVLDDEETEEVEQFQQKEDKQHYGTTIGERIGEQLKKYK